MRTRYVANTYCASRFAQSA